jgi:ribosome maturation factor RimP
MGTIDAVRAIVEPLLADQGAELVDLEHPGPVLRVVVDRPGGIDLDGLSSLTKRVSRALDEHDPIAGRYTLEVSSPGLERPLRTPAHYRRALGAKVAIKTVPGQAERRLSGVLTAADDDSVVLRLDPAPADGEPERRVAYADIERARTVFEWGPPPKPGKGPRPKSEKKRAATR